MRLLLLPATVVLLLRLRLRLRLLLVLRRGREERGGRERGDR